MVPLDLKAVEVAVMEPKVWSDPKRGPVADLVPDDEPLYEMEATLVGDTTSVRSSSNYEGSEYVGVHHLGVSLVARDDVCVGILLEGT